MANWVTGAIEQARKEIDDIARVRNYNPNVARYAQNHRDQLISQYGAETYVAIQAKDKKVVAFGKKEADVLKKASCKGEVMVGRVRDVVSASSRYSVHLRHLRSLDELQARIDGRENTGCRSPF